MKANELRIGNFLIMDLPFGTDKMYKVSNEFFNLNIEYFKPIPITEEWLLKFGFEQRLTKDWFFNDKLVIEKSFKGDVFWIRFRVFESESIEIAKLKYVHQLQNLYYALTNKEL